MKKIFITLITCLLIVSGIMFVTRSDFLYTKLEAAFESEELEISELKDRTKKKIRR